MSETPDIAFDERDEELMGLALAEADRAAGAGDVPVGALVADAARRVLAAAGNRRQQDQDPTAHAELLALRAAAARAGSWRLEGCILYVTLEPCAMCAAACVLARLGEVVYATSDPKAGFVGSLGDLLSDTRLNHRVPWRAGLRGPEAAERLWAFFAKLRGGG